MPTCYLLACLFFLTCLPSYAQTDLPADTSGVIYTVPQQLPEFAGGKSKLKDYIRENIRTPKENQRVCCVGSVYFRLSIDVDGKVNEIKIIKVMEGACEGWNKEAIRLIENMPQWKPAIHKEKRVKSYFFLPISVDIWRD